MIIRQLLVDAYGCTGPLDDAPRLLDTLRAAAAAVGATEFGHTTARFVPHGVTAVLILAESHLLISTWPEHQLALVDILLCNPQMDPEAAWAVVRDLLQPDDVALRGIERRVGRG